MEGFLTSLPLLISGIFHFSYAVPNVTVTVPLVGIAVKISGTIESVLSMKFLIDSPSSGVVKWNADVINDLVTPTAARLLCRQEYDDDGIWTDLGFINLKEGLFIVDNLKYPYAMTCVQLLPSGANLTYSDEIWGHICNRTFEDVPSEEPQDFQASCQVFPKDHMQRNATFWWNPIPRQNQNGVILRYQLRLESQDSDLCSTTYTIEPNTTLLYIKGGLSTRVTYLATLVAYNRKGPSPPTYYRLAPLDTVHHADRINTIVFILLVILGLLLGAWWARHDPRYHHNAPENDLYKDSSVYRQKTRRSGVTHNDYSALNNNV